MASKRKIATLRTTSGNTYHGVVLMTIANAILMHDRKRGLVLLNVKYIRND